MIPKSTRKNSSKHLKHKIYNKDWDYWGQTSSGKTHSSRSTFWHIALLQKPTWNFGQICTWSNLKLISMLHCLCLFFLALGFWSLLAVSELKIKKVLCNSNELFNDFHKHKLSPPMWIPQKKPNTFKTVTGY